MSHAYIATNAVLDAHKSDIYTVAACEKYTVTGSGDGKITLWPNGETDPKPIELESNSIGIHHLSVDYTGTKLASVGFDAQLRLYDLHELKEITTKDSQIFKESNESWAVAFAKNEGYLAVSTIKGDVHLWDVESFGKIQTFSTNKKGFGVSVDVSPDGSQVAVGFEKGGLYMYNTDTGRLEFSLSGHSSAIRAVAFSPAGNFLAAGGDSKVIALYDTTSGEHVANLPGHEGWIFSLNWNESGEYLLSTCYDGKCKIWKLESRLCVATQSESNAPLMDGAWYKKTWGANVVGGFNQGIVTVGAEKAVRWYREASGQ